MSPVTVVLLLTLLLGIQPITTDLYLPALPTVQASLGASIAAAQLTLSALIICFGIAQLVCGPLADRFGRRPVLLSGLALYTVASVFGAAAPSIEALIVWRALQGAAMAAAVTCGRSIVRDLYEPGEGARVMSRALSGLGVIAALSPLVGGLLIEHMNWHLTLLALALFGAAALAFVAWRFEETIPRRDPGATRAGRLLHNWSHVVANPTFRAWALLSACTYSGLFFLLAGSSFVFINVLGTSRVAYGAILGSISHRQTRSRAVEHAPLIALEPRERGWLHARIAQRFAAMLDAGFIDEVRALRARGDLHPDLPSMRSVGYRQAWAALDDGRIDRLAETGTAATRQLAKRQLTWLRSMPQRRIVACDDVDAIAQVVQAARSLAGGIDP